MYIRVVNVGRAQEKLIKGRGKADTKQLRIYQDFSDYTFYHCLCTVQCTHQDFMLNGTGIQLCSLSTSDKWYIYIQVYAHHLNHFISQISELQNRWEITNTNTRSIVQYLPQFIVPKEISQSQMVLYSEMQPMMRNRKCHQITEVSFFLSK